MPYSPWNNPYQPQGYSMMQMPYNPPQMPMPQQQISTPTPMPTRQTMSLNGRFINSLEEVTPNEVPMDGNVAIFPQSDYKCVYIRGWNTQGKLETLRFVPDSPAIESDTSDRINNTVELSDTLKGEIFGRFDALENSVQQMLQQLSQRRNNKQEKGNE